MIIDEPLGLSKFARLLAWTTPETYLALPIVVLIATYHVILRCRERLEFVALMSGGQSTLSLTRSTTAIALVALMFSLLISGVVYPYAKFAFRTERGQIRTEGLSAGGASGRFYRFPNHAIYVFPSEQTSTKRPIFIQEILDERTYRIINADRVELLQGPQTNSMAVRLIGATVHSFENFGRTSDRHRRGPAGRRCRKPLQRVRPERPGSANQKPDERAEVGRSRAHRQARDRPG